MVAERRSTAAAGGGRTGASAGGGGVRQPGIAVGDGDQGVDRPPAGGFA